MILPLEGRWSSSPGLSPRLGLELVEARARSPLKPAAGPGRAWASSGRAWRASGLKPGPEHHYLLQCGRHKSAKLTEDASLGVRRYSRFSRLKTALMPSITLRRKNGYKSTSVSHHVQITRTRRSESGRIFKTSQSLSAPQIRHYNKEASAEEALRVAESTLPSATFRIPDHDTGHDVYEEEILRGRATADISHAGEALSDEAIDDADQSLLEQPQSHHNQLFRRRHDTRTRSNRMQILVDVFTAQMDAMTDVYMDWAVNTAGEGLGSLYAHPLDAVIEETRKILVVDVFSYYADVPIIEGDLFVASAYVHQGLMPVAPHLPTVVITVRTLETFRRLQLRCPRLGVQPFVRALCDLHGAAPRPYLSTQFIVAFNLYLALRAAVDRRVQVVLGRDSPDWRLKNACPACLYKLEGEAEIPLPFLPTIDGNNSLKRFWRRQQEQVLADGDYYIPPTEVDKWASGGVDDLMKEFVPGSALEDEGDGCSERWENMKQDVTACTYGMYDETGFPLRLREGKDISPRLDERAPAGDAADGVLPKIGKPPRPGVGPLPDRRAPLLMHLLVAGNTSMKFEGYPSFFRRKRALDELEGLIVSHMFELTKVNLLDTGYKLRKHIATALQARSKGVKTALDIYNDAAALMMPPRNQLSWEQIVNYAFLADFDLLREGREDLRAEPLLRTDEEIVHLNLEIPRLVTHMVDEEVFLLHHEQRLSEEGSMALVHQITLHRTERGHFNTLHMDRLVKLSKEPGFTASIMPGVSVSKERRVPETPTREVSPTVEDEGRDVHAAGEDVEMGDVSGVPASATGPLPRVTGLPAPRLIVEPPPGEEADADDEFGDLDVEAITDAFEHIFLGNELGIFDSRHGRDNAEQVVLRSKLPNTASILLTNYQSQTSAPGPAAPATNSEMDGNEGNAAYCNSDVGNTLESRADVVRGIGTMCKHYASTQQIKGTAQRARTRSNCVGSKVQYLRELWEHDVLQKESRQCKDWVNATCPYTGKVRYLVQRMYGLLHGAWEHNKLEKGNSVVKLAQQTLGTRYEMYGRTWTKSWEKGDLRDEAKVSMASQKHPIYAPCPNESPFITPHEVHVPRARREVRERCRSQPWLMQNKVRDTKQGNLEPSSVVLTAVALLELSANYFLRLLRPRAAMLPKVLIAVMGAVISATARAPSGTSIYINSH
ncbi:hypothetical protein B0H19DRAFT_1083718 [Mycena capillaripes]|nr:hypothetical protein B0H19DRAFT_1083718 [Mycena capillaripes]